MSTNHDKMKKPLHRGNYAGDLDVFDLSSSTLYRHGTGWRSSAAPGGPRMSLDMPNMMRGSSSSSTILLGENKPTMSSTTTTTDKKKQKQPSSPGGRLASFLNSLFSQSLMSGKKKKKSTKSSSGSGGTQSSSMIMKDIDDEIRRKRRSSISHFGSSTATTPTPIKTTSLPTKQPSTEMAPADYSWLDEKLHWDRKQRINYANGYLNQKDHNKKKNQDKEFRRFHDHQDGEEGDSDSSSDLFELQINYDLGYDHSCGLPVYETTHMDNIKRPPPMIGSTTR